MTDMILKSVRLGRCEKLTDTQRGIHNLPEKGCCAIESWYDGKKVFESIKHFESFRDYLLSFGPFKDVEISASEEE